jgi:hypothetical protein
MTRHVHIVAVSLFACMVALYSRSSFGSGILDMTVSGAENALGSTLDMMVSGPENALGSTLVDYHVAYTWDSIYSVNAMSQFYIETIGDIRPTIVQVDVEGMFGWNEGHFFKPPFNFTDQFTQPPAAETLVQCSPVDMNRRWCQGFIRNKDWVVYRVRLRMPNANTRVGLHIMRDPGLGASLAFGPATQYTQVKASATTGSDVNLLTNGNFGQGLAGWHFWHPDERSGGTSTAFITTPGNGIVFANATLFAESPGSYTPVIGQDVGVVAGETYKLSCRATAAIPADQLSTSPIGCYVVVLDGENKQVASAVTFFSSTQQEQALSASVVIPSDGVSASVWLPFRDDVIGEYRYADLVFAGPVRAQTEVRAIVPGPTATLKRDDVILVRISGANLAAANRTVAWASSVAHAEDLVPDPVVAIGGNIAESAVLDSETIIARIPATARGDVTITLADGTKIAAPAEISPTITIELVKRRAAKH